MEHCGTRRLGVRGGGGGVVGETAGRLHAFTMFNGSDDRGASTLPVLLSVFSKTARPHLSGQVYSGLRPVTPKTSEPNFIGVCANATHVRHLLGISESGISPHVSIFLESVAHVGS